MGRVTAGGLLCCLVVAAHAATPGAPSTSERFAPRAAAKHLQFGAAKAPDFGRRSEVASPAMRSLDGAPFTSRDEGGALERRTASAPFAIHWQTTPELVRQVRELRRRGLPIVHLWQSTRAMVAIGLNKHGVPGIYITQRVPD